MTSQPVGGFDLVLGNLYNDGWFNLKPPEHDQWPCIKCAHSVTIHNLHKYIFAFGQVIEKFTRVATCPTCLHECKLDSQKQEKKQKATKQNLGKIFAKLPKSVQQQILMEGIK